MPSMPRSRRAPRPGPAKAWARLRMPSSNNSKLTPTTQAATVAGQAVLTMRSSRSGSDRTSGAPSSTPNSTPSAPATACSRTVSTAQISTAAAVTIAAAPTGPATSPRASYSRSSTAAVSIRSAFRLSFTASADASGRDSTSKRPSTATAPSPNSAAVCWRRAKSAATNPTPTRRRTRLTGPSAPGKPRSTDDSAEVIAQATPSTTAAPARPAVREVAATMPNATRITAPRRLRSIKRAGPGSSSVPSSPISGGATR